MDRNRATGRVLALTALALTPAVFSASVVAQAAGSGQGVGAVAADKGVGGSAAAVELARAKALVDAGQLVHAKAILGKMDRTALQANPDVRDEVLNLMKSVEHRLTNADPLDVSLQKADLSVTDGDFLAAERHARAVMNKPTASVTQRTRAQEIVRSLEQRRNDLTPLVMNALDQIASDFRAGMYSQAKGGIMAIKATGVVLSEDQVRSLDRFQGRILELEAAQGRIFPSDNVGLALFQPGVVRRDRPAGSDPAPAPAPAPSNEAPQPAPTEAPAPAAQPDSPPPLPTPSNETAPAPVAQPAEQTPPPVTTPPAPSSQDDLITLALRADAQRVLAEADKLYSEGRYNLAQEKYLLLLAAYRQHLSAQDISHAETRQAESAQALNQGNPRDNELQRISTIREATRAEFTNAIAEANKAIAAGDTSRARSLVAGAQLTYGKASANFNPHEQNEEFIKPLQDINRQIEAAEARIQQETLAAQTVKIQNETEKAEAAARQEKQRRINEAIDRARALQQEQKYAEALQVVDQILFLDNRNPAALLLRDALSDIVIYRQYWDIQRDKQYRAARMTLDAEEAMIAPTGIMEYPADWPTKTFERGDYGAFSDTAENKRALAKLEARIPVTFRDNTVRDIFSFVTQLTDVPVDPDWESLRDVGVTEDTTVNFNLSTKLPARTVLDRVLAKVSTDALSRAGWAVSDGVVRVASQDVLNQDRTLVLYDIQDLLFDIPNFYDVPQIDLQSLLQQAQQGGGGGGQSPFQDNQQRQQQGRDPDRPTREDRITLIRTIITANVDPEGWVETGGEVGTIQELNGSLIINNTPKNHREIVGLLSKLRQIRSMQINVETKFLLVNQNWFEAIGFDVDVVLNADNNQVRAVRGTQPNAQPGDLFDFGTAGSGPTGTRRGLLRRQAPFDYNGNGDDGDPGEAGVGVPNPTRFSPVGIIQDSLGLAGSLVEGDFATGLAAGAPALGISGQFLDDIQVDFLIMATQADKRTVQLTAPRLTFTNGQTANIFVVTQQAFVSDLEPVVGDSAVGFDPEVSVASEGVTMLMEGVISSDRRYVTLNVDAGVGRIDGFEEQPVTAVAGGQLVNSADTQSLIQLPTITVTRVRTSVTVPDEGTVLLGGQRLITELEIEVGVPVLSKIPILNRFFTNRIESKTEQTLLILLKPTILIQAEQEEKNFPGLQDSLQTGLR